ncbi:MAG: hypothetical protein JSW67_11995 [Candidatus Latescibacterota bacterium]|nr:MAG: hypothetical protein JSW67_11995 [Candidatus Latescibacterota bacterium]
MSRYAEIDLSTVRTVSIHERDNKVGVEQFGRVAPLPGAAEWMQRLPSILAAENLRRLVAALQQARAQGRTSLFMLGGHVMKTGISPFLIDLMRRGYITHFASNGSLSIHDVETALFGRTSEDVAETLERGVFGMVRETPEFMFAAFRGGREREEGMGECLGRALVEAKAPHGEHSLMAESYVQEIAFTVHVSLGGDILHQHPGADGATLGELSMRDFRILAAALGHLGEGGVVVNLGSAVVMPEVFLKALTVARNVLGPVHDFTTANLDMLQHYRPAENVLRRPTLSSGTALAITGHHELLVPLLHALLTAAPTGRSGA